MKIKIAIFITLIVHPCTGINVYELAQPRRRNLLKLLAQQTGVCNSIQSSLTTSANRTTTTTTTTTDRTTTTININSSESTGIPKFLLHTMRNLTMEFRSVTTRIDIIQVAFIISTITLVILIVCINCIRECVKPDDTMSIQNDELGHTLTGIFDPPPAYPGPPPNTPSPTEIVLIQNEVAPSAFIIANEHVEDEDDVTIPENMSLLQDSVFTVISDTESNITTPEAVDDNSSKNMSNEACCQSLDSIDEHYITTHNWSVSMHMIEWLGAVMYQFRQTEFLCMNGLNELEGTIIPTEIHEILNTLYINSQLPCHDDINIMKNCCDKLFYLLQADVRLRIIFARDIEYRYYVPQYLYTKAMFIYVELTQHGICEATYPIFQNSYNDLVSLVRMFKLYFSSQEIPLPVEPEVETALALSPLLGHHRQTI